MPMPDFLPPPPWIGPPVPRRFLPPREPAPADQFAAKAIVNRPAVVHRPGCTAADNCLVVLGYLDGLARGNGGFGVLRIGKERMEEGARAAQELGQNQIADAMWSIGSRLHEVLDPETARAMADELRPVADQAWDLGRTCKGDVSPAQVSKAKELAVLVREGKMTVGEAMKQIRGA